LKGILNNINHSLHRPTTTDLDNIAEPTTVKMKRISLEEHKTSPTISQNNVISNWMSWTLGRGEKKSKVSEPIPQHKLNRDGLYKKTFYTPDMTESSSSSASLTPSPKYTVNPLPFSHAQGVNIRKNMRSVSSISIIDDSDSESSSASSQYRVDAHHALHYTTLPRSKIDNRTLADYEREINGLRSAMENLQVKLSDAERKLQEQQAGGSTSGSERSTSSAEPTLQQYNTSILSRTTTNNSLQPSTPNKSLGRVTTASVRSGGQTVISIQGSQDFSSRNEHKESDNELKRLIQEENALVREQGKMNKIEDKELMIALQQRKIQALDEANTRLVTELNKVGEKTGYKLNKKKFYEQETPKTVDELLDSFSCIRRKYLKVKIIFPLILELGLLLI